MYFDKRMEERIVGTPAYYEKKKRDMEKRDIFLLNQQLQTIMKIIPYQELKEKDEFKQYLQKANQMIRPYTVLDLAGRQHYENENVLLSSAEFLLNVIPLIENKDKRKQIWFQLREILPRIKRIHYGKSVTLQSLEQKAKKSIE